MRGSLWRRINVGVVIVCLTTVGCSRDTGITSPMQSPPVPKFLVSSSEGSHITIVDENDGTEYTLDVTQREITSSNGEILVLDEQQMQLALPEFLGTLAADPVVPDFESIDPNGCQPEPGIVCPYSVSSGDLSTILWRSDSATWNHNKNHSKAPKGRKMKLGTVYDGLTASSPITVAAYSDVCQNVANAALPSTIDYRVQRTSFLRDAFNTATVIALSWAVRKQLLPGSIAAGLFAARTADRAYSRIRMGALAFYWNQYDCANRQVTVGPLWVTGSGSGGGGSHSCGYQDWTISFDNGATWSTIRVLTCYTN